MPDPANNAEASLLIVDDEQEFCRFVEDCLASEGYALRSVHDGESAIKELATGRFDVLLCDYHMKGVDGMAVVESVHELDPGLPVVMITAFGSLDHAVEAMRAGAYDYVTKPVSVGELRLHVRRAVEARSLRSEVTRLRRLAEDRNSLDGIVARSEGMRKVIATIRQLERSTASVLITGESGTGKEVVARAIHMNSPVSVGPFVPVNCASIPEQLLESELFGHARGAFTDARNEKAGLFHAADGGTLFLDEIGEMPAPLQSKLLRVLEDGVVRRVGATEADKVNVRVVSATNRNLVGELDGDFRADLYYRLNVVEIHILPLRERREDIPAVVENCLRRLAGDGEPRTVSRAAMALLTHYEWPGNVRQLQNAVEHAVALSRSKELDVDDLPDSVRPRRVEPAQDAGNFTEVLAPRLSLGEVEGLYIDKVLEHTAGNRTAAAAILGIDRKTLYKRLRDRDKD